MRVIVQNDIGQTVHTWQGTAVSVTDGLRRAEQTWQARRKKEMENLFGRTSPPGHAPGPQNYSEGTLL